MKKTLTGRRKAAKIIKLTLISIIKWTATFLFAFYAAMIILYIKMTLLGY